MELAKKPAPKAPPVRVKPPTEKRMANRAAYAAIQAEYLALPDDTRVRVLDDFRFERVNGGTVSWARYLEVVLPLLPAGAR